jgi:catechol 2,3-dioxygenase-like lactoylglutathione lyase family enzyme
MLTSRPIMPVLPVTDLERARRFYSERLGLRPSGERSAHDAVVLEAGHGTKLELLKRDRPTKAEHTALTFEVDDIDHEVAELEGRGVRFEDYDLPGLKTERHIAKMDGERAAWFKDTEGNILCIHQRVARG